MFADSNCLRIRRNGSHERPGFAFSRERQSSFNFRVPGKVLRVTEIESAARSVDAELSLLTTLQRAGDSVDIRQIKSRRVYERAIAIFGRDFKSPQRRFGERIFDSASFVGALAGGAIGLIRGNQQNLRPDAFEAHDVVLSELATVQADVVRSDSCRQRLDVEKLRIPFVDLQPNLSGLRVPVEREVAGELLHAGNFFGEGLASRFRSGLRRVARAKQQQNQEHDGGTFHEFFSLSGSNFANYSLV